MSMLTFHDGNRRFNYRSVAVILHKGMVLLHKAVKDDFWALPGGRVEFFEPASTTVVRELREEICVEATVNRPLWFVENFFEYSGTRFHEVSTYFLMDIAADSNLPKAGTFSGHEPGTELIFKWFPIDQLGETVLYPSFLRTRLAQLPDRLEYITVSDLSSE